jgi:hypothetical protein
MKLNFSSQLLASLILFSAFSNTSEARVSIDACHNNPDCFYDLHGTGGGTGGAGGGGGSTACNYIVGEVIGIIEDIQYYSQSISDCNAGIISNSNGACESFRYDLMSSRSSFHVWTGMANYYKCDY